MQKLADWWDQYAGYEVGDLPRVHGGSLGGRRARRGGSHPVARADVGLKGPTADLAFWRGHLEGFRTPAAFARVVTALDRGDRSAAVGLLVAWLGESPGVPLEDGEHSFHALVRRWAESVCSTPSTPDCLKTLQRFFEALEANAEDLAGPLACRRRTRRIGRRCLRRRLRRRDLPRQRPPTGTEGVVRRRPRAWIFLLERDRLGDRLQFLGTVADLWRIAGRCLLRGAAAVAGWLATARVNAARLDELLDQLHSLAVPEPSAGFEGAVEYDRRRSLKEHLTEETLSAAVATDRAIRSLQALAGDTETRKADWESLAVEVERRLATEDVTATRAAVRRLAAQTAERAVALRAARRGGAPTANSAGPDGPSRALEELDVTVAAARAAAGNLRRRGNRPRHGQAPRRKAARSRGSTAFSRVALQASVHAVLDLAIGAGGLSDAELTSPLSG